MDGETKSSVKVPGRVFRGLILGEPMYEYSKPRIDTVLHVTEYDPVPLCGEKGDRVTDTHFGR